MLSLRSPAFADGGEIPAIHTCEGQDVSPALEIDGVPNGARSLVLVVHDPDAPDPKAPRIDWVHWILYNLPPSTKSIPQGVVELPPGTLTGMTDFKRDRWGGPCPPVGQHRYVFELTALDTVLPDLRSPTRQRLEREMTGHLLGKAKLTGLYAKKV